MRHQWNVSILLSLLATAGCSAGTSTPLASLSEGLPLKDGPSVTLTNIVGDWETTHFGRQILTTRPDGTATIDMRLTAMAAAIYGRQVTLDLRWTLDGNVLTQQIVGGSPEKSVNKLIARFGHTRSYNIVESHDDYLKVSDTTSVGEPVLWTAMATEARQ